MATKHHHQRYKNLKAPADWQLLEKVGDGSFGSVYKLKSKKSGQLAAVKVVESIYQKAQDDVLHELEILKKFANHPNIVHFLGAYKYKSTEGDQLWLVMELCRGGSVTAMVKRLIRQGSRLNEDLIGYIVHEALKGLEVLHEKNVIHRDIKGANILLTSNAGIKLVDFGVSAQLSNSEARKRSSVGTPYWMSPEVIACDQQFDYSYDKRCDVWSIGITTIELADGSPPFYSDHPMRALFKIPRSPPPAVSSPSIWSIEMNDFVAKCVIKDFERRPFVHDMLKHKFIHWVYQKKNELQQSLKNVMYSQYGGKDGVDCDNSWYLSPVGAHREQWRDKKMLGVDDLVTLENLTEETILTHIMERYLGDQIYTYIGDILIAVNPFKNLPIYDMEHSLKYRNLEKKCAPPHIYAIADSAYRSMVINQQQQCCLISGESGAGKTVSSNFLVQQLAELGKGGNSKLENRILQVNPLMEALGNAQTGINDNSSRFGKYLELHFTSNGNITGARLVEYLLEKSRVVSQAEDERNFHVFYYFIAGLWRDGQLSKYSLRPNGKYKYLQTGKQSLEQVVFTTENKQRYDEFRKALEIIGFTQEETSDLFSIIAAIIHIGDIDFIEDDSDRHIGENSKVNNYQQLQIIASLLNVRAKELSDALTTSSNVTRGETISRRNTVEKSLDCRDAMAKALYDALFSWIVDKINHLLSFENNQHFHEREDLKIGILDIFGFENVQHNSFEQLFINIANEQIQYYFNQYIFSMEMNEYVKEGIPATKIAMKDNKHMIELFLQRPIGLLALLDEESGFPKATDTTLIDKFNSNIYSESYQPTRELKPSFSIKHFAGEVTYDARGFLEKNRDTMSPDIIHVLRTSEFSLLRGFFSQINDFQARRMNTTPHHPNQNNYRNSIQDGKSFLVVSLPAQQRATNSVSRRQQTLSMTFRNSLEDLLLKLTKACPHFVRCIKPNDKKMADQFNQERVMTQLRYTGVLETTRLRKEGYSERITFKEFVRRYQLVLFHMREDVRPDALSCKAILRATGLEHWLVGKTKIFLKYHHVEKLETILEKYRHSVILVQRAIRAWLQRKRFLHTLEKRTKCAIVLQKVYRGRLVRKKYGNVLNKREKSATIIQKAVRGWIAARKYQRLKARREKSSIQIQATYRGFRERRIVQKELAIQRQIERERENAAAQKITAVARGFQARKQYGQIKGQSCQLETKMIYLLQQVSYLGHEFQVKQNATNQPVPAEDRHTEPMQYLIGPPPGSHLLNNNGHYKDSSKMKQKMHVKRKPSVPIPPHANKRQVATEKNKVKSAVKSYKTAKPHKQEMVSTHEKVTQKRTTTEAGKKGPPVTQRNIKGYKVNPLIVEAEQAQRKATTNEVLVVDTSAMKYGHHIPEKELKASSGGSKPRNDGKGYSNAHSRDNIIKRSGNVLLVRNPSNVRYIPKPRNVDIYRGDKDQSTKLPTSPEKNNKRLEITQEHVASPQNAATPIEPVHLTTADVPYNNLRAKLRKTGEIEEGSGLHRMDVRRQHTQVHVINVK